MSGPAWRSVDDPPEDQDERVLLRGGPYGTAVWAFRDHVKGRTHWMPLSDLELLPVAVKVPKPATIEWVSFDDLHPPLDKRVLVDVKDGPVLLWMFSETKDFYYHFAHWAPLPLAPQVQS